MKRALGYGAVVVLAAPKEMTRTVEADGDVLTAAAHC